MAGDWIKMTVGLRTHPKIVRMSSALKADRLRVIGGLFAVWSVFDQHSIGGQLEGYTLQAMDDELGWRGFSAAMQAIGWLEADDNGLTAPRFDEHNGTTAKRRALDNGRKKSAREADKSARGSWNGNGHLSACEADKMEPREEKRREEKNKEEESGSALKRPSPPPPAFDGENQAEIPARAVVTLSPQFELPEEWGEDAERLGWPPDRILTEAERYRQYYVAGKGAGTRRALKGWRQAWSNWLSKAESFGRTMQ